MRNVKLTLAYDGTRFLGWQKTNEGPSIEQELETVLGKILQEKTVLQATSRTDAGVHARGQIVNFRTEKLIPTDKLHLSLCCLLPKDVVVIAVEEVHENFHPTLDVAGKEYHYWMCTDTFQYPEHRLYSWHYPYSLDLNIMQEAAESLIGTHDFSAFCNLKKNQEYEHCIREVKDIRILPIDKRLRFEIVGKSFLYKMVRNLVGSMVCVGRGKIAAKEFMKILETKDRRLAGVTAPAHGLILHETFYS